MGRDTNEILDLAVQIDDFFETGGPVEHLLGLIESLQDVLTATADTVRDATSKNIAVVGVSKVGDGSVAG